MSGEEEWWRRLRGKKKLCKWNEGRIVGYMYEDLCLCESVCRRRLERVTTVIPSWVSSCESECQAASSPGFSDGTLRAFSTRFGGGGLGRNK